MIKSIRSEFKLNTKSIKVFNKGDIIDYEDTFYEVLSILNFDIEHKDETIVLIVDYICQDLKKFSQDRTKAADPIATFLHPFEISIPINKKDAHRQFKLGRGFHHRNGYYQIIRYKYIEFNAEQNVLIVVFESLPIQSIPGQEVRKKFREIQLNKIKTYQKNIKNIN